MNKHDKLIQLAEFAKTGEVFEFRFATKFAWIKVKLAVFRQVGENDHHETFIILHGLSYENISVDELLSGEFRSIPKLPLLTEEECEFLKCFPKEWWIVRQRIGMLTIYMDKPVKGDSLWQVTNEFYELIKYSPALENIKWSDSDCHTIGELIEYAKKVRNSL